MIGFLLLAAAAGQEPARTPLVVQPDYRRKPSLEDILRYYPPAAAKKSLPGQATIDCVVDVRGALTNCRVVSEEPVGEGFGEGALAMSPIFKMRPMTVDGVATGGAKVRIPIHFLAPPPPTPAGSLDPQRIKWAAKPSGEDFANYYPASAAGQGLEGRATLQCVVSTKLRLSDCAVLEESPPGFAFGQAALRLSRLFQLPAPEAGAESPIGRPIRIPIGFRVPH